MKSATSGGRSAKSSLLLAVLFAAGLHGALPSRALSEPRAQEFTIVHPTGTFPTDVEHVQAAVDAGGAVVLKATDRLGASTAFNFGPAGPGGGSGQLQKSNVFVGNNIERFESGIADVFLDVDTEDTVLVGFSGAVIDSGTNNRITGFTKLEPGADLGQPISEVQAQRRERIEAMLSHLSRRAIER